VGDANILEGTVREGMAQTALGALALGERAGSLREAARVLVLVRPEQVQLGHDGDSTQLQGRVTQCHFYGHDMLVTVETSDHRGRLTVQARLTGRSPLGTGSLVSLSVAGPVKAWPA
jgi:ABC-type sugar transport system ATPase subunit